jgi:GT2 family glycosyltransferase
MAEEQMRTHLIYPIIVNWNLAGETILCIESLRTAGVPAAQIIVVDNGSQDDSVAQLTARFGDGIRLIAHPTNLGFAGGNNIGIEVALQAGAEWVLLVNNDTVVAPTFMQELDAAITQQLEYRIIGPLILYHSEPNRIWSLGDRLVPGTLITRRLWHDEPVPDPLAPFIPVDFLNACCMLIHRTVFEQIGLLDATYFMYAEDVDFCWRARRAGIKLGCATRARIWHKVSRSTGVYHPQARYWRISNQIRVYRTHARRWQLPMMFGFTLIRSLKLAAVDFSQKRTLLAQETLRAWRDGWWPNGISTL